MTKGPRAAVRNRQLRVQLLTSLTASAVVAGAGIRSCLLKLPWGLKSVGKLRPIDGRSLAGPYTLGYHVGSSRSEFADKSVGVLRTNPQHRRYLGVAYARARCRRLRRFPCWVHGAAIVFRAFYRLSHSHVTDTLVFIFFDASREGLGGLAGNDGSLM